MNTPIKKSSIGTDTFGSIVTLNFSNGQELSVDVNTLAPNIKHEALLLAIKSKLVDAAAIPCDRETGRPVSIEVKYAAVRAVYDRITRPDNPQWHAIKVKSETAATSSLLVRALMKMSSRPKADVDAQLSTMTTEQKAAMKKNQKVAQVMLEIQAELTGGDESARSVELLAAFGIVEEPVPVAASSEWTPPKDEPAKPPKKPRAPKAPKGEV